MKIRVAQIKQNTTSEGPGNRFALWVQGCSIRCAKCCNPEMFSAKAGNDFEIETIVSLIKEQKNIEGVSILGGEPFDQPLEVLSLAKEIKKLNLSVMIYSGYTLEEIKNKLKNNIVMLESIDLLVDGRYDHTQPETNRRWVGSKNQTIHYMSNRYSADDPQFKSKNTVEIFFNKKDKSIVVNGWPLQKTIEFRGLRK